MPVIESYVEAHLEIKGLHPQLNNLEKAVAAAHTFLKKNPNDPHLTKNMNYYKTLFDVEEYLIDHEEQPYEVRILSTDNIQIYSSV